MLNSFFFLFCCILNNPVFHHSIIPALSVVLIEIVSCFFVILQGADLQILSLRLFSLFIGQFSRMAPLSLFFIPFDLPVRFAHRTSLDHHRWGEENPGDRILTMRASDESRLRDPLDYLKALTTAFTTLIRINSPVGISGHGRQPPLK